MTFRTSQGLRVETIEHNGHATPFYFRDFVVLRVAVNGKPFPAWQIPASEWQKELGQCSEDEFWQNVADAAFSMNDVMAALTTRA